MYSSKFKIFLCFIISGVVLGIFGFVILPKLKNKDKTEKLALVDLSTLDSDSDGLSDKKELELKTNLYNPDTDSDGYSDLEEVKTNHDPLKVQSRDLLDEDNDGLTLEDEKKYGTNPKNADSDYDGYNDGQEIVAGHSPLETNLSFLKQLTPQDAKAASALSAAEGALNAQTPQDLEANLSALLPQEDKNLQEELNLSYSEVSAEDLKIQKEPANREAVQVYVNSLGILGFKTLPFSMLDENEMQNYFSSLDPNNLKQVKKNIKILDDTYSTLKDFEIPNDEEIILWHKDFLNFFLQVKSLASAWKEGQNDLYSVLEIFKQGQTQMNHAFGDLQPRLSKIADTYNVKLPAQMDFYQKISR